MRRLILHFGLSKTGTTALQVAFAKNRHWLAERGVHYPEGGDEEALRRGRITSGNGLTLLVPYLAPRQVDPAAAEQAKSKLLSELDNSSHDVLYSSETLFTFDFDALEDLTAEAKRRDVQVHAVVLVRNIADHAWSAYLQHVKSLRYTGTFSDYLSDTYGLHLRPRLTALSATLGGHEHVQVISYDRVRHRLVETVMADVFGIEDRAGIEMPPNEVNRSLTGRELAFMLHVNRDASLEQSRVISEALMAQPSIADTGAGMSDADVQTIRRGFEADVEWVNDTYFEGRPVLEVGSRLGSAPVEPSEAERTLLNASLALARRII